MGWNINNLAPDGHGWRARLGVLTHDDSAISESELWTMAPMVCPSTRPASSLLISRHTPILPARKMRQTSLRDCHCRRSFMPGQWAAILLGTTGEEELLRRVEQHSNGIPVLMSAPAATAAFRALEAERIALIHAPFFTDDFDQK